MVATRTPVLSLLHTCSEPFGRTVIVYVEGKGYTHEYVIVEELMDAATLADYRAECEMFDAMARSMPEGWAYDQAPEDDFMPDIDTAIKYADAVERLHGVDGELTAFHAPSECYRDAYRGPLAEVNALRAQAGLGAY